ncbi:hypothetical protein [Paenibacillus apiarius]|uniref:hypothetical protein n=1 Tax=Paenibacillus apiarius TaxID=46240 RepID=UPI003B3B8440
MSPVLSRPNFFLSVLNQMPEHDKQIGTGSLEQELQSLLLLLAQSVQAKQALTADTVQRINDAFQHYHAVRLKLSLTPPATLSARASNGHPDKGGGAPPFLLHTEFVDPPHQWRRIYMEAILSLLEAMETEQLELQRCIQCHGWFIPYQRAKVNKFCSAKCRNRYNYVQKKNAMKLEEIR